MEWLWSVALVAIIFGPVLWVFLRDRTGGAPSGDDVNAGSTVTDSVRHTAGDWRAPGGSGKGGPLLPP